MRVIKEEMIRELSKSTSELNMSVWETDFIDNIKHIKKLSGRQFMILCDLYNKIVKGFKK